jgi:hypothetical protein
MYYSFIKRTFVLDPIDCFILSSIFGSLLAIELKKYVGEKAAIKRLKNSIIKKCELSQSKKSIKLVKISKNQQIYRFALLNTRGGGGFEELLASPEFYEAAVKIQNAVEKLAVYLKSRNEYGYGKFFF